MMDAASTSVRLRTPEGVEFAFELAGPVTRFLAWLLDLVVILAALQGLALALRPLTLVSPGSGLAVSVIAFFVVSSGYGLLCEWRGHGQTLGKRLLRLRVMDEEGLPLRLHQLALRNLLRAVDGLPLLYVVGGVCMVLSPRLQRLGDLAAGTLVVRLPRRTLPSLAAVASGKYNSLRDYPHLVARLRQRVTPAEADLALQALLRREALEPAARLALFAELRAHLTGVVAFPPAATDGLSDEQVIRNAVEVLYHARD